MVEILEDGAAVSPDERDWMRRAVDFALCAERRTGDCTVLVMGEAGIRALNRDFRQKDAVTDVLSFPAAEGADVTADGYLGDIAVCLPRAAEQADAYGHSLSRELAFLCVHGALHLMGYDHIEPADEARMRGRQSAILEAFGAVK